jgi:hypothetical protein
MPTINYPALSRTAPSAYTFNLIGNTLTHASPLSGAVRTLTTPGARWRFTAEYRNLSRADAGLVAGFLAALEGAGGRFYAYPFHRQWPLGTCRATGATANAASVLATSIDAVGLGAGVTLLPGDFFALSGYLYCVTAAMTAGGGGAGTIQCKPGLRVANGNGAALTFFEPKTTFRLLSDENGLSYAPGRVSDVVIEAVEAFL